MRNNVALISLAVLTAALSFALMQQNARVRELEEAIHRAYEGFDEQLREEHEMHRQQLLGCHLGAGERL